MTRWIFPATIAVVLITAVAIYWTRPGEDQAETSAAAPATNGRVPFRMEQQWLIKLKLAQAEQQELPRQIYSTGRVVPTPSNHAVVAPPINGIIDTRILPRIGQRVTRGQVLLTLIQTPTAAEAAQIHIENSRVDAERRRLAQAEMEARARLTVASNEAGRARRLFERKAYSQRQLEVAEADQQAAQANLSGIQEQIGALKTAPMTGSYEVVAPISGIISEVRKAAGEEVRAGEAIMEIVALDKVWVEAPVFEKDLGVLSRNVDGVFTTSTFPGKEFHGTLINISPVIDAQTRAATVVFEVNNASGELRVGMQANMRLGAGEKQRVLLVPKESVLDNEGRKIVYVLITGEEFERREVVVGDEYGGRIAILSGIEAGERVVTQGAYQLKLQELQPANAGAHTHEI
jgi:membrane fusion protein, heavy metal efflux system